MKCPHCGLINADTALYCDCGYSFTHGKGDNSDVPKRQAVSPLDLTKLSLGTVFITTCAGFVCALLGAFLASMGLFSFWVSLGTPPGQPVNIIATDSETVYVKTSDERIFAFIEGQWIISKLSQPDDSQCSYSVSFVISPPNHAKDSVQQGYCFPHGQRDMRYVLLEDGSIWRWSSPERLSMLFDMLPMGIFAGLVIGALLIPIVERRAIRKYFGLN